MISKVRQERILKSGSEYFTIALPVIAAGAFQIYDIDTATELIAARKYKPLDFAEITNNDIVDVELSLDFLDTFLVPKGVIKTISERAFCILKVKNISAVDSTASKIYLTLQRLPITVDTYVRKFQLGSRGLFNG